MTTVDCSKGKCWLKRPKALLEASNIAGCSPMDFTRVEVGKVHLYAEKKPQWERIDSDLINGFPHQHYNDSFC